MLRRLLNRLGIDRAVFYALVLRGWQLLAGVVSLLIIAQFMSREIQGFYYTFASLMALQAFFELGFNIVVINFASHEWAHLQLDQQGKIVGDEAAVSRLVSLGRLLFKWYAAASFLFMVLVGIGGAAFLVLQKMPSVAWHEPWIALILFSGLFLWTLPFVALLEGCHQVAVVNRFRVLQAIAANIAVWSVIALGGELWAAVAATLVRLLFDLYLLCVKYRRFFQPFWRQPTSESNAWRSELWPMQWRLALQGIVGFFEFELFILVMFHYHGAIAAGQMGMTWTAVKVLQAASIAWVQTRAPLLGSLISERKFDELDRLYRRLSMLSLGVVATGGAILFSLVYLLNVFEVRLADRLLPPLPTGLFALAVVLKHLPSCQVFYLRAHRREPLLWFYLATSAAVGLLVWQLGSRFGAIGAGGAYLAISGLVTLPVHSYLWLRIRKAWHAE